MLAALAVLSVAGLSLMGSVVDATRAVANAERREAELADEDRLLAAQSLLTRRDLEIRLGTRPVGPYLINVQRPEPDLFRIALRRAVSPETDDLVTVVFRPDGGDAN